MLADGTLHAWWLFAGKLHPAAVHFPIALLIVAAVLEFARLRCGDRRPGHVAMAFLAIGAPAAVLAALLGWSNAQTAGHTGSTAWVLQTHRWLGVAAAAAAMLTLGIALLARARDTFRPFAWYRFSVLLTAALVGLTGHFGGSLIHGPGYLQDAWRRARGDAHTESSLMLAETGGAAHFHNHVLPILGKRCFQCHAGDKPEAGLRLDSREAALAGGESGAPALVPGDAEASLLVRLIRGEEPDRRMPPKGAPLTPDEIAAIESWIGQGAKWTRPGGEHWHWAYRAPQRPPLPEVRRPEWVRDGIDRFILARLEVENLAPSPEADRSTLIRRLSLDLTGLPPTPAEVRAFQEDPSPDAYERLVDRLLASPAYGERMAMKWLDLARYADTHGYEKDERRTMWPYRDWVIEAFNRDLSFDQFTIEQIAGDLMPDPTTDQLVATGFNRNTQINEEGGVDPEEFRVDAVIDRVNTVGTAWLGSTFGCAQCHDHKNDPVSIEDYYRLFAIFNNDDSDVAVVQHASTAAGGMLPVAAREHREEFARLKDRIAALQRELSTYPETKLAEAQARWEKEQASLRPEWTILAGASVRSRTGASFTALEDGSHLASGKSADKDVYTIEAPMSAAATGLRLEVFPDPSTPGKGVGRSGHGNIVLQNIEVAVSLDGGASFEPVPIVQAAADHEQGNEYGGGGFWPIAAAIDSDPTTGWGIGPKVKESHTAAFRFERPIPDAPDRILRITLTQNYGGYHTIGRFRLGVTKAPDPLAGDPLSPEIEAILSLPASGRSAEQSARLAAAFRAIAPELRPLRDELDASRKRYAELTIAKAMVMRRAPAPRETRILEGGSFLSPGAKVEPGVPAVFESSLVQGRQPRDRLELARWITSERNPLTARVAVNRMWELHFGAGLVETSEDFGTQGDPPTHPELLDYLATEFVRSGWSMKAMHRLIVTSATYRQSSNVPPELLEKDPYNKLLARGPRFRVDAETIRDIALASSGLLSPKIGGPSVFPPQPEGVWTMIYSSDKWVESQGEDRYRRGLYTFWRRTAPFPAFAGFDATSREVACTRRARTNTPLQALTTLNDPQFVEAAVALAQRMIDEGGADDLARIRAGFLLSVSREPERQEADRILALVAEERDAYRAEPEEAKKLIAIAPEHVRAGADPVELAAWSVAANILLNLDETITRP